MSGTTDPIDDGAAQRWQRVRGLLEAALNRPEAERGAFVEAQAGSDEALRQEVLELLLLDGQAGFELQGRGFADLSQPSGGAELPRLGPWKALRELGSGGMGTVYLGVRADGQFKKRVALKVIKRGMDTDDVLRRFERERQVLASLDHPGIARLIDGGVSEDERPYLVLEYVEGELLDRWCDAQRMSLRERVQLFCQVCEAIDEAHRRLVVHRDLKPGNVLVDAQGRPRLLDFGIAKVLDPEKDDQTVELTATPLRMMTPAYASPEQIRGQAITTSSDIYSLGALLFYLLVGRPPFELKTASALEIERMVCESTPPRASQVLQSKLEEERSEAERFAKLRRSTPRALVRDLRGDLDTVLAKAMRKEPRRRYASAADLRADLQNWLRGLPVAARPDTASYRVSKFVRRHRFAVAASSLALASLLTGLVVSLRLYHEARDAGQALQEELQAGQLRNEELERLNAELEQERSEVARNRLLAEQRAQELEVVAEDLRTKTEQAEEARTSAQGARAEAERLREQAEQRTQEVRSFANTLLYDVHRELVPLEGAFRARKLLVDLGLSYLDKLAQQEESESDPQLSREVVGGYLRLAELQGDDSADTLGDSEAALQTLAKAVEIGEALQEREPESLPNDFTLGSASMAYGDALHLAGRAAEAAAAYLRAAEVCGLAESDSSPSQGRNYVLNSCLLRLGQAARQAGDLELAGQYLDEALWRSEELAARVPGTRNSLATIFFEEAEVREAGMELEAALAAREQGEFVLEEIVNGTPGGHPRILRQLRSRQIARGALLLDLGRFEEGLELARRVCQHFEGEVARAEPGNLQPLRWLANANDLRARAAMEQEAWNEAQAAVNTSLESAQTLVDRQSANGFFRHDLARAHLRAGLVAERRVLLLDAEGALREACEAFEENVKQDPTSPFALRALAQARASLARVSLALAEREGLEPSERGQWLRRAKSLLLEVSSDQARVA